MGRTKDVIVVGAGIVGATSAFALGKAGWKVRIIEAAKQPGLGASLGNGRQLSYSYTNALASPAVLRELPRLACGKDDAFRMALPFTFSSMVWLTQFLRNCAAHRSTHNTLSALALAEKSRCEMEALLTQFPLDFEYKRAGKLTVFQTEKAFSAAQELMLAKVSAGSNQKPLTAREATEIEPALVQYAKLVGAIYAPGDYTGNCALFAEKLIDLTCKKFGAEFHGGVRASSIEDYGKAAGLICDDGAIYKADQLVVCAGHHSHRLLSPLGYRLPMVAMKGYSFTAPKSALAPKVSVTDSSRRIVLTDLGDRLLVAGAADLGDDSLGCSKARTDSVLNAAKAAFPDAADYNCTGDFWAGHRPLTPNSLPITKRLSHLVAVNTGHGMLGWTLAMGSAAVLKKALQEEL
jgi:D-amino-acid dehydrogenase